MPLTGPRLSPRGLAAAFLLAGFCAVPARATQANGDADLVLGQPSFTANYTGAGAATLNDWGGMAFDGAGDVWVADTFNHRVLEFMPPFSNGERATLVLGQPNLTSHAGSITQSGMAQPRALAFDGAGNLWVAEYNNSRVTEFIPPFSNGMPAALLLGQQAFNTATPSDSQSGLHNPDGVAFDSSGNLWVADASNNRVVGFPPPFSDGMNAAWVLGQAAFGTLAAGGTQAGLSNPAGLAAAASGGLWVCDYANGRVLEYGPPFSDGMNAALVLGQTSFSADSPALSQTGVGTPAGIALDASGNVWVSDYTDNRVLQFPAPVVNGENASLVLGQATLTSFNSQSTGVTQSQLNSPTSVTLDPSGNLWVDDEGYDRVLAYDLPCAQVTAGVNTIQSAVNAVPNPMTGDYCISVGPGTYDEQVSIQGINTQGFRLTLEGSGAATVSPPASSEAAFVIGVPSISVSGFSITPGSDETYGVEASAPGVTLQDMVLNDTAGIIQIAGVELDQGASSVEVAYSTFTVNINGAPALYAFDSSNDTLQGDYFSNLAAGGDGVYFSGGAGELIQSSLVQTSQAPDAALYMSGVTGSTVSASVIADAGPGGNVCSGNGNGGDALVLNGGGGDVIAQSIVTSSGASDAGLYTNGSSSDQIMGSYVADAMESNALQISGGAFNTVSQSTIAANSSWSCNGFGTLYLTGGASSNTITQSFIFDPDTNLPDNGNGIWLDVGSFGDQLIQDTVAVNGAAVADVTLGGPSGGNTLALSYVADSGGGTALYFDDGFYSNSGNSGDAISSSTFASFNGTNPTVIVSGSSSTLFTNLIVSNSGGGDGFQFYDDSEFDTVSLSTVTTQSAQDAAVYVNGGSSNTLNQDWIYDPGGYNSGTNGSGDGVQLFNAGGNTLAMSTVTTNSAADAALYLQESSANTFSQDVISDVGGTSRRNGNGIVWQGSQGNTLAASAVATAGAGSAVMVLQGESSDTISGSFLSDSVPGYCGNSSAGGNADGLELDGADGTSVVSSTITTNGASYGAVALFSGDSNSFTDCYIQDSSTSAGALVAGSFNSFAQSVLAANSANECAEAAVDFVGAASSNSVAGSFILDPDTVRPGNGNGLLFNSGVFGNSVSGSTIATTQGAGGGGAAYLGGSRDTISGSYISDNGGGDPANFTSSFETIAGSTIAAYSATDAAVFFDGGSSNVVTGSFITDPGGATSNAEGDGVKLYEDAGDVVSFSTVATNGAGDAAVYAYRSSSDVVLDVSAADTGGTGGTSAMALNFTGAFLVSGSRLSSNPSNSGVGALNLLDDNVDFAAQNNVISGGPSGSGILVPSSQTDYMDLSSNTVTGAAFGLTFQAPAAPQVAINGLNFQSLASNATAIEFLGGQVSGSTFTAAGFDATVKVPVDASQLSAGSALYLANPSGPGAVQSHDDDPGGYVHFTHVSTPTPVANFAATVDGVSSITWTWSSLAGVSGYNFYSPPQSAPAFAAVNQFVATALSTNTAYVAVVAANNDGVVGPLSPAVTAYTPAVPPVAPVIASSGPFGLTLQWSSNGNPGYTPYQVQLWTTEGSTTTEVVTSTSASFVPVAQGTTYFLQVRAQGLNGVFTPAVQASTYIPPCVYVYQGVETIQSVTSALPALFTSNLCIQVETGTYGEGILIPPVNTAGYRLTVRSDGPQAAVLQPPGGPSGTVLVEAASVTVRGFLIQPATPFSYGVELSSSYDVADGLVLVDPGGAIGSAGFYAAPGVVGARLSDSTITVNTGGTVAALFDSGSSHGCIVNSALTNLRTELDGVVFRGGAFNQVSTSTINAAQAPDAALFFDASSSDTVTGSIVIDTGGYYDDGNGGDGVQFAGGAGNVVTLSTVSTSGAGDGAVFLNGDSGDLITRCYIADAYMGAAIVVAGNNDTVSFSTAAGNTTYFGGGAPLVLTGVSSATVTRSFIYDPSTLESAEGGGVVLGGATGDVLSFDTISVAGAYNADIAFNGGNTSCSVISSVIQDPDGGTGIVLNTGDEFDSIAGDSIQTFSASVAAVFLQGASSDTVTGCQIQDLGGVSFYSGDGIVLAQAVGNVISFSTIVTNGANDAALFGNQDSSDTFGNVYATDQNGTVAVFLNQSGPVEISSSGFLGSGGDAMYANQAGPLSITGSVFADPDGGDGAYINGGPAVLVAQSTFSTVDAYDAALYLYQVSGSTVTASAISDAGPGSCAGGANNADGLVFDGSNGSVLSYSVVASSGAADAAVFLTDGSSSDTLTGDTLSDGNEGAVLQLASGSGQNLLQGGRLQGNSSANCNYAVLEVAGSQNTVSNTIVVDPDLAAPGNAIGLGFDPGANYNLVQDSTFSVVDTPFAAAALPGNTSDVLTGDFIADSGGVDAVYVASGSGNSISSSTIQESANGGPAVVVDEDNSGLTLSSDSVTGGPVGVQFLDSAPGLSVSTLTFRSLAFGATAMQFLDYYSDNPVWDSTFSYVDFADDSVATNADASQIQAGNLLTFADAQGPREGTQFDDDPNHVVVFLQTPGTVGGLQGAALGISSIAWSWNAMPNTTGYEFYFSSGGAFSTAATTFAQTGLGANTSSVVQVQALDDALSGPLSAGVTAYTLAAQPSGLSLTNTGVSTATFTWGAAGNSLDTSYQLEFWIMGGSTVTQTAVASTTGTLTGLNGGTTYYVDVRAVNGAGLPTALTGSPVKLVTLPLQAAVMTIGSSGGSIPFSGSQGTILISIPPAAFASSVTFTVEAPAAATLPPPKSAAVNETNTNVAVLVELSATVQPSAPVEIELSYSGSGLDPADLVIAQYNPSEGIWVPLPSTVNQAEQEVTAYAGSFLGDTNSLAAEDSARLRTAGTAGSAGLFEIMSVGASASVDDIKVFPNPFRPALGETSVTFSNLPAGASVKIFTLLGERVRELSAGADGIATWDGTNSSGVHVASDVYFVLVDGTGGKKVLKLIVQR